MKELKGIVVAMVTPFKEDGSLNLDAEKKLVRHFIDAGVGGLLVSGGTGEFTMMNVEERKQVIKTAVDEARDSDVSIMAGITCNNTKDTVELAAYSSEVGADYVLVQPPHAIPVRKEDMIAYFEEIKANTKCGMVLYHFPAETGVTFSPEEIVEMGRKGLFCAVKNTASMEHTQELILANAHDPSLKICNGFDSLALASMACGADYMINAGSNMAPVQYAKIIELVQEGKLEEAKKIYEAILPLMLYQEQEGNTEPGMGKFILREKGFEVGTPRKPVADIAPECQKVARELLKKAESVL